jgi:hypothetical protein
MPCLNEGRQSSTFSPCISFSSSSKKRKSVFLMHPSSRSISHSSSKSQSLSPVPLLQLWGGVSAHLGPKAMRRIIVCLTHGGLAVPRNYVYETYVTKRGQQLTQALRRFGARGPSGDGEAPVVVVENSTRSDKVNDQRVCSCLCALPSLSFYRGPAACAVVCIALDWLGISPRQCE